MTSTYHPPQQRQSCRPLRGTLASIRNHLIKWFREMPLAQGSLTWLAFAVVLGSLMYGDLETVATIARIMAATAVAGLGVLTLWFLQQDRRRERGLLRAGVGLLMLSNFSYLFDFDYQVFTILHDVAIVVVMLCLFVVAVYGYRRQRTCKPGVGTKTKGP